MRVSRVHDFVGVGTIDVIDATPVTRTRAWPSAIGSSASLLETCSRPRRRDEKTIRNDDFGTFRRSNDAGADADAANFSDTSAHLNDVANFDRTFEEEDETGDKIIDDVL